MTHSKCPEPFEDRVGSVYTVNVKNVLTNRFNDRTPDQKWTVIMNPSISKTRKSDIQKSLSPKDKLRSVGKMKCHFTIPKTTSYVLIDLITPIPFLQSVNQISIRRKCKRI